MNGLKKQIGDKATSLLQLQAITKSVDEEICVYDNSNIAESYSGIVLPLTCSFVKLIYTQVYKDVARTSNISHARIKENKIVFDNLITFFYGRIYYNIFNWYKMLTLFPGYNRNKKNLDEMISLKSRVELDLRYQHNVHFLDKIKYYHHISWRILHFERDIKCFKEHVKSYLDDVKSKSFEDMSLVDLWEQFEDYKKELLCKWSITVDNDFLAMTWFGIYKNYAERLRLSNSELIIGLSSMQSLISSDQVKAIATLAHHFQKNNTLTKLAKEKKWEECYSELMNNPKSQSMINEYLAIYGGRFANELKLESKDLESDPMHIVQLLYLYQDWTENSKIKDNKTKLPFYKSIVLSQFAAKTKHYLRNREELRLLRSRAFSFTRKLFTAIGKKLEKNKELASFEDIFYLELQEIESVIKEKKLNLQELVEKRKAEYETYKDIMLDNVLITKNNGLLSPAIIKNTKKISKLQGVGCSPGKVSGTMTVLNNFEIPKAPLEIVVVKNTDPGWTPLFGLCKGLIVENGGLLSHAAIISRELNLPCVIGVKNATKMLRNGQKVTLDGYNGTITVGD